jgi:transposase-like protein
VIDEPRRPAQETCAARQHQRRLSPEQIEQLVAAYQAGEDMKTLAARWQLHRTTVAGHLVKAGIELRRQGLPDNRLRDAAQLYSEGWSCARLAERFDCNAETVRQRLKAAGVQLRSPWERV